MNKQQNDRFVKTLIFAFLLGFMVPSGAETKSPLDISQHPTSPEYQSLFIDQVVPLDTQLSWKRRFLGDESFNVNESLPSTGLVIEQLSINSSNGMNMSESEGTSQSGFDTTGVVKQVKLSEGKVKIKHGPVERLGMPAMTMIFVLKIQVNYRGSKRVQKSPSTSTTQPLDFPLLISRPAREVLILLVS